jgi:aryl-alcohol dehydrogenase-like predicted oxidoreductase
MIGTQEACALHWKFEQFHRELKQLTEVEKSQVRKARIRRNHMACVVLAWVRLKAVAGKVGSTTVYHLKQNLLAEYLRSPSARMNFV